MIENLNKLTDMSWLGLIVVLYLLLRFLLAILKLVAGSSSSDDDNNDNNDEIDEDEDSSDAYVDQEDPLLKLNRVIRNYQEEIDEIRDDIIGSAYSSTDIDLLKDKIEDRKDMIEIYKQKIVEYKIALSETHVDNSSINNV